GISTLTMPPSVSIPSDSGVTSRSSMLVIPPARICAWTAAPSATTSSGLSWLCGVLPNSSRTRRRRSGTRVEPPTRTTSSMSDDRAVEVVAAEVRITVGREHLEDAVLHAQDRDVERPAPEVVDGDHALLETVQSIGE